MKFSGTWKGFDISDTASNESNEIYFLDFIIINGLLEGEMRVENNRKEVTILQVKGTKQYIDFQIDEKRITKSTSKQKHSVLNQYYLKYNLNRGYLEGYKNDSSNKKIILFKSKFDFNSRLKPSKNRNWVNTILSEYRNGLSSPEKRLEELKNFSFEPIYFEYDKSNVREEYHEQLKEIKKIILSHSDLRILVIGHTDSDGSNKYNESLSKRRAESIIRFFTTRGLRRDRIVIDFKGETFPVQSNKTSEGKSMNRRVDFKFI
ncbi:MAG: OmpA family protein [Crocinitomicaceae bacterium]|jgi:outer membrane protein OmpA-like peptidoglycan-associated protein|nr:OmpA family protein [Crocinitomicaceae bacterium]